MLLFSVGNSAMNAPRNWQRRNEWSAMLATVWWCLSFKKLLLTFNIFKHLSCLSNSLSFLCVSCIYTLYIPVVCLCRGWDDWFN
jgi:hypothetical protein